MERNTHVTSFSDLRQKLPGSKYHEFGLAAIAQQLS